MKEIKFKLPSNADSVKVKVEDGFVVATYEPKIFKLVITFMSKKLYSRNVVSY